MKICIIPDGFKESLQQEGVANAIERGVLRRKPDAKVHKIPLGDGGEGTMASIASLIGGRYVDLEATGPLGNRIEARYLDLDDHRAYLEMAEVAGIGHLASDEKNPERTTTYGVGEMLLHAAAMGFDRITLGIGGSATSDGGLGMLRALGYRLLDESGRELAGYGEDLYALQEIHPPTEDPLAGVTIEVLCDVDNPLYGLQGAAHVYAPQKGADPAMVRRLDRGLRRLGALIGDHDSRAPGAGAAGGIGATLLSYLGAKLSPGFEVLSGLLDLEGRFAREQYDLVVTAEGVVNHQTLRQKLPVGVLRLAKRHGVYGLVLAAGLEDGYEQLHEVADCSVHCVLRRIVSLEQSLTETSDLLEAFVYEWIGGFR